MSSVSCDLETKPEGNVAMVTGGTRGIGAAITRLLLEDGLRVAACYRHDEENARRFIGTLGDRAERISLHRGDVERPEDCQRVVEEAIGEHGRIDYLVNNAGITRDRTLRRLTHDDWHKVLNVNLFGAFSMTKCVIEHMVKRGTGRIVNISSIVGQTGNLGQTNYAASKAGLIAMTKSLALETASRGITVNVVAPGFIATEMVQQMPPEAVDKVLARIPQGRLGRPDEVAHVVRFLLDDRSSYITGAVFHINGGLHM